VVLYFFGAGAISSIIIAVVAMLVLLYSLYQWFLWANGNYIITNQRVIRTEQMGLFRRQISEAEIDRIQEISTRIAGPIHTILNFGTVQIRTSSGTNDIDIADVSNPYDIQQEIARIQRQFVEQNRAAARP